jgi:carbon-monoxide dehydrogenase small subunit
VIEASASFDLHCRLNGRDLDLTIEQHELLLDVLRDRLGLRGAKRSCDAQVCGACTVLVDDAPVSACSYLAYEAHGKHVQTIEGLAQDGKLHPIQQAFVELGALQCGFCTPGMILTVKALLMESPRPDEAIIRDALRGNLCRCTGYAKIVDAVMAASQSGHPA